MSYETVPVYTFIQNIFQVILEDECSWGMLLNRTVYIPSGPLVRLYLKH